MRKDKAQRSLLFLGSLALLFLSPLSAQAHTTIQGTGEFISGLIHPVTTPAHIIILLALGILAGQHSAQGLKIPLIAFAAASAVSLALTIPRWLPPVYLPLLTFISFCLGILVAIDKQLPRPVVAILLALPAVAIGLDSGVDTGTNAAIIKTLIGTWVCLILVVFDLAFYVSIGSKKKWIKVGVRVLGSWIVAISMLMLAFFFKKSK